MNYVVNSSEMKEIDRYTVEECNIPALELMERAANEVVAVMKKQLNKESRILAVCGAGNNGGDGIAAGRILYLQGYHVAILFIGEEEKASASTKVQLKKAKNLEVPFENSNKLHEYNIIIDAIFGIGLTRAITGDFEKLINLINSNPGTVFSVDIPSGISADSGKIMKVAVKANETITFGHHKQGLLLYPGAEYAGQVTVADIGFPKLATKQVEPKTIYYSQEDLNKLPPRKNYSHKGTYGKVLVIGGSKGMSGAAFLSAKAAYRAGAGLVKVLTSETNRVILQTLLPEALFSSYDDICDEKELRQELPWQKLLQEIAWASVIVLGPGIGQSATASELLEIVNREAKVPVIIDADGITLLAKKLDQYDAGQEQKLEDSIDKVRLNKKNSAEELIQERLKHLISLINEQTILTPHLKELSRLIGVPVSEIANNLIDTAHQCSYNKLIYAIKDARTIVTRGDHTYINVSGNNGMATGGSGDVLTGIIAAFIAQGMAVYEATCLAVYVHGLAGDWAAQEKGFYSLMASDIVNSIENVIRGKG